MGKGLIFFFLKDGKGWYKVGIPDIRAEEPFQASVSAVPGHKYNKAIFKRRVGGGEGGGKYVTKALAKINNITTIT